MTDSITMPKEIAAAIALVAKRRAGKGASENDVKLAELKVMGELRRKNGAIDTAVSELVADLRENPDNTWPTLARVFGTTPSSFWTRAAVTSRTPEERARLQAEALAEKKTRVTPDYPDGLTLTQVEIQTGITPGTVRSHIAKDPEGTWFVRLETAGSRGFTYRIVDLGALKARVQSRGRW